jgi:D-serine deaminase-like pyridoxal phosphate-dependent protein
MPTAGLNLLHIKQSLDSLSAEVEQGMHHTGLLNDLKMSVDQLRLTLWAVMSYEAQASKEARGAAFGLSEKLADFRLKRLLQMLSALREDIRKGNIPPSSPDLIVLSSALQDTLEKISKLAAKRG